MKKEIICREILSRLIAVAVVISGTFVLSSAATYAQVSSCQAKAKYEAAKQAAETAQREFNKYKLPGNVEKELVKDATNRGERLPEQKVEVIIAYLKYEIGRLKGDLHFAYTKELRDRLKERIAEFSQQLTAAEMWLNARKLRNEADRKLELSRTEYMKAITVKDSALKNARATFDNEQAHIRRVRASLEGRPQDAAYIRSVTLLLTRTRATYERLLGYLSQYDCFVDVRNFMDSLKPRLKKIDTNMTIVRNASPTPARPSVSVSPPAPPSRASTLSSHNLQGAWECNFTGPWKPTSVTQSGKTLSFTNEFGDTSPGIVVSPTRVKATKWQGGLGGTVANNGKTIHWDNGSTWRRR